MKRIIITLTLFIQFTCPHLAIAGELLIGPSTRVLNQFHGTPTPGGISGFGGTIQTRAYGVDYGGEVLNLGHHRINASLRLGRWVAFGQDLQFRVGAFTGPVFQFNPNNDSENEDTDEFQFTLKSQNVNTQMLESSLNTMDQQSKVLEDYALGWNLAELATGIHYVVSKRLSMSLTGAVGYQVLVTGEDLNAGGKHQLLNEMTDYEFNQMTSAEQAQIKDDIGARALKFNNLDALYVTVGAQLVIHL